MVREIKQLLDTVLFKTISKPIDQMGLIGLAYNADSEKGQVASKQLVFLNI